MISEEIRRIIQQLRMKKRLATPGPYKVLLGRLKAPRFDIVPESDEKYIISHCHIINPKPDENQNWHNDCDWIVSVCNNFDMLAEKIDELEREIEILTLKSQETN